MDTPMAQWLVDSQIHLMISLDGIGEPHNLQRLSRDGKGTFAKIEQNIDQILLPSGIRPFIYTTITGRNANRIHDVISWAIDRNLPFGINLYRENPISASQKDLKSSEEQIINGLHKAYQVIENSLSKSLFLGGILDRIQFTPHKYACGIGRNYLSITHTGEVAQCPMHLDESIPYTKSDDLLKIAAKGHLRFISVDEKEECNECTWRYFCAGGCPSETYRATGRFDTKSPHCNIYQALLPEAFRLEGLKLLKTAGLLAN